MAGLVWLGGGGGDIRLRLAFGAFPIAVSSFAIFFRSYVQQFHAGRAAISLALTIHNFMAAFLAAWIGRLTDRSGARKVILPGLGILGHCGRSRSIGKTPSGRARIIRAP
jgi:MFS family permease